MTERNLPNPQPEGNIKEPEKLQSVALKRIVRYFINKADEMGIYKDIWLNLLEPTPLIVDSLTLRQSWTEFSFISADGKRIIPYNPKDHILWHETASVEGIETVFARATFRLSYTDKKPELNILNIFYPLSEQDKSINDLFLSGASKKIIEATINSSNLIRIETQNEVIGTNKRHKNFKPEFLSKDEFLKRKILYPPQGLQFVHFNIL